LNITKTIDIWALDIDGVLTDGRVAYTAEGEEIKFISYHDLDAVFEARRLGIYMALITAEDTPWVQFIAQRLEIDHIISQAKDKLKGIQKLAELFSMPLAQICYMGDSDRDAPALSAVGLSIAPANATAKAKSASHIVLNSVGGHGAVHEALEYVKRGCSIQNR
jgi:YrbI family 3-deoxy-D-manno-octulosonate 8-phosphate phosphatase